MGLCEAFTKVAIETTLTGDLVFATDWARVVVLRPEGRNLRFVTFINDASHLKNLDYNMPERRDLDLFLDVQGLRAWMVSLDRHIENIGRRKKKMQKTLSGTFSPWQTTSESMRSFQFRTPKLGREEQ
jgi:hypothetical protein